ncbi:MAG: metallophosphoesterase [Planctomycetaceae bacterium]|nr:metallophosphoesterase [Planctomycetaceae bacterium]
MSVFPDTKPRLSLLQISDLHFGPPFRVEVAEAVLRLAPTIAADAVIISGDLTQRARREQFEQAKVFLSRLPAVPRMVIPGNHDVPLYRFVERMVDPYRNYRAIISTDLNPVLVLPSAILAGLNSSAPHTAISNGWVSSQQLDACEAVFQNSPESLLRVVVCHHPFIPAPDRLRDKVMWGAGQALRRLQSMGVRLILGGHLHRAYTGRSQDFYFHEETGGSGILIVHSGTTTSSRGRGRERQANSLNHIEIFEGHFCVTTYLHSGTTGEFEPVSQQKFATADPGMEAS